MTITRRRFALGGLMGSLLLAAGCGRKGALEAPEEREEEYRFPRQYPAPETVVPSGQPRQSSRRPVGARIRQEPLG